MHTDASFRFERGADPNITLWALKRAAILISEIAGGKLYADFRDVYPEKIGNAAVTVSYDNIKRLIGKEIDKSLIKKILGLIDIRITGESSHGLTLEIPAYKVDVHRDADVIEEILRIYGYNNIETDSHVNSTLNYIENPDREKVINMTAETLSANGFSEIMCNSLVPSSWFEENEDFDRHQLVYLANPLSSDLNVMRQSLLYGGLSSIAWNINRQNYDLKLYEFGNCYFFKNKSLKVKRVDNYSEKTDLDLFISGNRSKQSWNNQASPTDFYLIKSYTEMILARLGLKPDFLGISESRKKYFSESLSYSYNNQIIAEAGKISRSTLKKFDIGQDVYYAHLEWELILTIIKHNVIRYRELPKYPAVRRDLALLVNSDVRFSRIRELAYKAEKDILRDVSLFDVYESETLGRNKKSYAVSFILQDEQRTLTDKSIDKVMNNFIRIFEKELDAHIR